MSLAYIGAEGKKSNAQILKEDDFSIYSKDVCVWTGEFPYKTGDQFPTKAIKDRANQYKTNEALYDCNYGQIYPNVISFMDVYKKALSNWPILQLLPNLPEYREITETNVDLIAAKMPKIDGEKAEIDSLNKSIMGSNFGISWQAVVRNSQQKGNSVKKLTIVNDKPKIVEMPVKCWEPWVNKFDSTEIECNIFFNIYQKDKAKFIEFVSYLQDGTVENRTFNYGSGRIGTQIGDIEVHKAFENADISPIVVFTGCPDDTGVLGKDLYRYWEASIAASIRAFGTLLQLLERTKEITKVMPASATTRDESTGATYDTGSDTILYDDIEHPAKVEYVSPTLDVAGALSIYELTVKRVSRDTSLAFAMFDTKELGNNASGKALKVAMYKSELRAKSFITSLMGSLKELIYKFAILSGIDIELSDFSVICDFGFISDAEEETRIVQSRLGNQPTMTLEEAIAKLDDLTTYEAQKKANSIRGVQSTEDLEDKPITPVVTLEVALTQGSEEVDKDNQYVTGDVNAVYPLGGDGIG